MAEAIQIFFSRQETIIVMLRVYHRTLFMDFLYDYDLICQVDGWVDAFLKKSVLHWHKFVYVK